MNREKLIIIGGGVGPAAGVKLHERIIQNTKTNGADQDHIEVHHYSRSEKIGDRTLYLFGDDVPSPIEGMFETMQIAQTAAKAAHKDAVAGIPCNTFHAPKIWDEFMRRMEDGHIDIHMLHMLEETVMLIQTIVPHAKSLGLMSTTGTRRVGVYRKLLEPKGFQITEVPQELQDELHDSIYNSKWGIKAVSPVSKKARTRFEQYAGMLVDQRVEAIILGCTEIPLVLPEKEFRGIPLIDPMHALARGLIREANPAKLKPLE